MTYENFPVLYFREYPAIHLITRELVEYSGAHAPFYDSMLEHLKNRHQKTKDYKGYADYSMMYMMKDI